MEDLFFLDASPHGSRVMGYPSPSSRAAGRGGPASSPSLPSVFAKQRTARSFFFLSPSLFCRAGRFFLFPGLSEMSDTLTRAFLCTNTAEPPTHDFFSFIFFLSPFAYEGEVAYFLFSCFHRWKIAAGRLLFFLPPLPYFAEVEDALSSAPHTDHLIYV